MLKIWVHPQATTAKEEAAALAVAVAGGDEASWKATGVRAVKATQVRLMNPLIAQGVGLAP